MKATLAKGTRDFLPQEVKRRDYIFKTIEEVFKKYGYEEIETPAIEALKTLTGKYGEEGDQLLFKILNNGDFLKKADIEDLKNKDSAAIVDAISKRGLRYDLTVPFSRFVVMHQHEIDLPFKRFQIQPVWRGDRPQKGRYQEFYQCDADIVGSDSLLSDAEFCLIYDEVFTRLKFNVDIRLNNRKILYGMAEILRAESKFMDLTIAIDKLDKVGIDGVVKILHKMDFTENQTERLKEILKLDKLEDARSQLRGSGTAIKGIEELEEVIQYIENQEVTQNIVFDISLARGLNYYTGTIYEVVENQTDIGSIGGGGRYDDLTAVFGLKNVPGVGISFGAARIYDIMQELNLFPEAIGKSLDAMIVTLDKAALKYGFGAVQKLRGENCSVDIYPKPGNMGKQLKYLDKRGIKYAIIIGSTEMAEGKYLLKDMKTGEQRLYDIEKLLDFLKNI